MATVVSLSALNEARLEVYVLLFAVCYFALSVLFRPRRRWFDVVGMALFLTFCYVVTSNALDILF
jgi:Ca2+/Na+ antiporter